jgi:hypothetical protein
MRQWLGSLGMKPADVEAVMRTAAANAKKNVGNAGAAFGAMQGPGGGNGGGMAGAMPALAGVQGGVPGMPVGMPGGDQGQQAEHGVRQARSENGGGGRGGFASLSEGDRKKARELMQKMQNASPEERKKIVEQLTKLTGGRGPGAPGNFAGRPGGSPDQTAQAFAGGSAQDRGRMIEQFAQTIGKMHDKGIFHGDLRLGNILVKEAPPCHSERSEAESKILLKQENFQFYFLDNERTKKFSSLPWKLRIKNLVQINIDRNNVDENDRKLFFDVYLAQQTKPIDAHKLAEDVIAKTNARLAKRVNK